MPEPLPHKTRTKQEVINEYNNQCLKMGHAIYQIKTLERDVELMAATMRDLNLEAARVVEAEKKAEVEKQKEVPSA